MSQNSKQNVNAWNVDLYVVTWNVSSKFPDGSPLTSLLGLEKNPENDSHQPDFYIIGLQEIKSQPQDVVMGFFKDDPWTQRFKDILKDRDYIAIKSEQMQGMLLILFAKRKHLLHLRQIETEYTRTGLGGMWGNKGAISIRLNLYGTAVSVVNAHLAAHDHMLDERIVDYNQILDNHHYHVKMYREIFDHDYVFWFGDLNFRLNNASETSPEDVRAMIQNEKINELLELDQLNAVRKDGRAFYQLQERLPAFPPTFKFERGTSNYDMKRRPAWCDRILYKVRADAYQNVQLSIEQKSYKSHPGYTISDHKPVTSEFVIKFIDIPSHPSSRSSHEQRDQPTDTTAMLRTFIDNTQSYVEFRHISEWIAEEDNIIEYTLPESFVERPASDWIGLFRHNFSDLSRYVAYQYVPSRSNLMNDGATVNERRRQITMNFAETSSSIVDDAWYVLLYFEREEGGATGVAGISNPFRAKRLVLPAEKKPGPNIPQSTNVHQS